MIVIGLALLVAGLVLTGYSIPAVFRGPQPTEAPRRDEATAAALSLTPIVLAASPLALRRSRWRRVAEAGAATLLAAFGVLGGFSVGLFYLPSAASMLGAAVLGRPRRRAA